MPLTDFFRQYVPKEACDTKESSSNVRYFTLDELEKIDALLESNDDICREEKIGAISKISPSEAFIQQQFDVATKYLREQMGISDYEENGFFKQILLRNVLLNEESFQAFRDATYYSSAFHWVSFVIDNDEFERFEQTRKCEKIYYISEDSSDIKGLILPDPCENVFRRKYPATTSSKDFIPLTDFADEIFRFLDILKHCFDERYIQIVHYHVLRIDYGKFAGYISTLIPCGDFKINALSRTLSFDFKTKGELNRKLQKINAYKDFQCFGFRKDHKYKVTFRNTTPTSKVRKRLGRNLSFLKPFFTWIRKQVKS